MEDKLKYICAGAKHVIVGQLRDPKTPVCASLVEYFIQSWYTSRQITEDVLNKANREATVLQKQSEATEYEKTPIEFSQTAIVPRKNKEHHRRGLQSYHGSPSPTLPKQNTKATAKDTRTAETDQQTTRRFLSETEAQELIAEVIQSKEEYIAQLEKDKTKLENSLTAQNKDMEKLRETFERTCVERDHLKRRLSKVAGDKLKTGNPDISDLSDPNSPSEIGIKFMALYDNEWTDAFQILKQMKKTEEEVVRVLLELVQKSYKYCTDQLLLQHLFIRDVLLCPDIDDKESAVRFVKSLSSKEKEYRNHKEFILLKEGRRECAKEAAAHLAKNLLSVWLSTTARVSLNIVCDALQGFVNKEIETTLREYGLDIGRKKLPNDLVAFGLKCAELSWYMVICDPPMVMSCCDIGTKFDESRLQRYTRKPKDKDEVVVMNVWPMLLLYPGGPLLTKGVAQVGTVAEQTPPMLNFI